MAEQTSSIAPVLPGPPTLHHLSSSQSLRVLWALEELSALGKPYNLVLYARVARRSPEALKKLTPLGKSPVLTIEGAPGASAASKPALIITESRLILQYISDVYSNGIWGPTNPEDKFRDTYWQEFANSSLGPILVLHIGFDSLATESPMLARPLMSPISKFGGSAIKKELIKPFEVMEAALSEEKPWFAGEKLGLADFNISWPVDVAAAKEYVKMSAYPKLETWLKRVHSRDAYKKALEKGGAYDLVNFK